MPSQSRRKVTLLKMKSRYRPDSVLRHQELTFENCCHIEELLHTRVHELKTKEMWSGREVNELSYLNRLGRKIALLKANKKRIFYIRETKR